MKDPMGVVLFLWARIVIQARTAQIPSFSLIWFEPVPKLSSPQRLIIPASIRFPKNFHPVGVSYNSFNYFLAATLSNAPEVGIDLAAPINPFLNIKLALAANIANESEGVTKNYFPRIIFLSASPSHAAPNSGISINIILL